VLHILSSGDESKALNKPSQDLAKENSIN
jgi:hypothetical protein